MKRTHVVDLYRRSGAVTEDSQGRETKAWGAPAYAVGVPCNLQMLSGSVEFLAQGRDVEGTALLLLDANALPAGVQIQQSDAVVVTSGRTPFTHFLVQDVNPVAERGEGWDDECVLMQTEVAIP